MIIIDNKTYEFKRLRRLEELAGALIAKPNGSYKHFTFITKGTKILSIGWNDLEKTSKLITYDLGGIHAEADAIGNLFDFNMCRRATLVNIRLNTKKELRNSKPCDACLGLILKMGFKRLYYSTNLGFEFIRL